MLEQAKTLFEKERNKVYGLMYLDAAYIMGKVSEIERKLKNYLILDPHNPYLLTVLMQAQTYQHKHEAAAETREKVLLLKPDQEPIIAALDSIMDFERRELPLSIQETEAFKGIYFHHLDEGSIQFWKQDDRLVSFFSNQKAHMVLPAGIDRIAGCSLSSSWHYRFYPNTFGEYDFLVYTQKSTSTTSQYWFWKQDSSMLKAKELLLNGELEEAKVLYEAALKRHPDHFYIKGILEHIRYVQETPPEVLRNRLEQLAGIYTRHKLWLEDWKPYVKRDGRARARFLPVSKDRYFSFSAIGEMVRVEFDGEKPLGYRVETYDPIRKVWDIGEQVIEREE
ncbi:MAG: hypothetical protein R3B47_08510 [Bacteroidia bacterium]